MKIKASLHGHSWRMDAKHRCTILNSNDIMPGYGHVEQTIREAQLMN